MSPCGLESQGGPSVGFGRSAVAPRQSSRTLQQPLRDRAPTRFARRYSWWRQAQHVEVWSELGQSDTMRVRALMRNPWARSHAAPFYHRISVATQWQAWCTSVRDGHLPPGRQFASGLFSSRDQAQPASAGAKVLVRDERASLSLRGMGVAGSPGPWEDRFAQSCT